MNRRLCGGAWTGARRLEPGRARPRGRRNGRPGHVEALLINGGGTPAGNYQSHLMHVRLLVDILREAGVPDRRVTILSGDGPDPAADVALREVQPEEDFWLLTGTRLEQPFRTPITYESSRVAGASLRAATRVELDRWFAGGARGCSRATRCCSTSPITGRRTPPTPATTGSRSGGRARACRSRSCGRCSGEARSRASAS